MSTTETEEELNDLFFTALKENASDVHLSVGRHPILRVDGSLLPLTQKSILNSEMVEKIAVSLITPEQKEMFFRERELDFAYDFKGKARFRVNMYFHQGAIAVALRLIAAKVRTIEELNLPSILHRFTDLKQGFFLAVGPSGNGKSTTLAAMVDEINHKRAEHIITIEDPVEYIFEQDLSIINQREVGQDTLSFHDALRASLREDPNVIMVGEMRDAETMSTAITAAETGHLVFSTLHTNNASQTIDRIIDSFPAEQQDQVRAQLSATLVGVMSERLLPRIRGGRIPAYEIMVANSAIRSLIRENKVHQLDLVIETGAEEGMISLNRSLANLVKSGEVTLSAAELYSLNRKEFLALAGK
jgi:twitching motility protein PilT